ncbi:MAG: hypothetical protein IJU36_03645 [Paludibacteraceae bacterium]|nr:hypothetical protein [Paludibacteraceae bacterium]
MKKLFSMFCALMVMLSVNAAPVALQAGKLSKNHFEKMQISKENVAQKAVGGKFIPGQAIKRAPAAKMETYDVTIVDCVGTYWGTDIQYIMNDADGMYRFAFDIFIPTGQEDVTLGQTYTLADMDTEYTWGGSPATQTQFADFTAATFVKTVDPVTGLVNVTASATDADGNVYNIVYQEQPLPEAQDTVTLSFDTAHTALTDFTRAQGMFQFVGEDANAAVYLAINSDSLVGHYTMDDINTRYTGILLYNNGDTTVIDPLDCQASVTFATAENMYIVTAAILGSDTTLYMAYMAYYQKPFEPTGDTIDVNITEPMSYKYYKSEGDWYMSGANAEYKVYLDLVNNDSTSPAGNYTLDQALYNYTYVTVLATGTKLEPVSLEATVTDVDGRFDVAADMLCLDGNVYHVTMFYAIPEALAFDTIVADNLELTPLSFFGMIFGYTASASNEDYLFSLSLDEQADGVYDAAGGSITNLDTNVASKIYSGSVTLGTAVDGTRTLIGDVLCMNSVQYTLDLSFVMPEPDREVNLTETGELTEYASDGVWQVYIENANHIIGITMNYEDEIAGTYKTADMYDKTYNWVTEINGTDSTEYDALGMEINVAVSNETETATITGWMIAREYEGTEVVKYNYNLTCSVVAAKTGLQYDEENADFSENFASYTVNDQYLASNGVLIVDADNDNDATIDLLFFVGEDGLVDGTYPVNSSEQPGTVWACTGVDSDGYIDLGFAGYRNAQGQISQVWFIVEGNVTVQGGRITVHALNSYGRSIDAVLNDGTGIEDVKADDNNNAEKFMRNGNLIIRRNGVEYNAQGATL